MFFPFHYLIDHLQQDGQCPFYKAISRISFPFVIYRKSSTLPSLYASFCKDRCELGGGGGGGSSFSSEILFLLEENFCCHTYNQGCFKRDFLVKAFQLCFVVNPTL